VDLKHGVSELSWLPSQDSLALVVNANGSVSAVDLNRHDKIWDLPAPRANDEMLCVTADDSHFYVFTREGVIRKYLRNREMDPTSIWQRPLDGAAELPLVLNKYLYAVTNFGTLYALAPEDGQVMWEYRPERKPTQMSVSLPYVYLTSEDGTVLILNAE
jgi:outer membrane protein assembly factor BamB